MTINEIIINLADELVGNETARLEVKMLIKHILNIDEINLVLKYNDKMDEESYEKLIGLHKRLKDGEPVQYIVNKKEFMGLGFYVDENVLIPRADTEVLVERILEDEKNDNKVLDMCSGSGCVGISLKKYNSQLEVTCADISDKAIKIGKSNSVSNEVDVKFIESDLFINIDEKFDIIVSNPPYIKYSEYIELENKVLDHEPKLALYADENGLYFYNEISKQAKEYLNEGGRLYFEIGYNQAEEVKNIMKKNSFYNIIVERDLKGKDRVIYGTLK